MRFLLAMLESCDNRTVKILGGGQTSTAGIPGVRWRSLPADTVSGAPTKIPSGMCLEKLGGKATGTQNDALKGLWSVRAAYQCVAGSMSVL